MTNREESGRFDKLDLFENTEANIANLPSRLRSRIQDLSKTDANMTGQALQEKLNEKEVKREERLLAKKKKDEESRRLANERRVNAKEIADIECIESTDLETTLSKNQDLSQRVSLNTYQTLVFKCLTKKHISRIIAIFTSCPFQKNCGFCFRYF